MMGQNRRREHYAPTLPTASLDFERVVNAYSISATRARLKAARNQPPALTTDLNEVETQPILNPVSERTPYLYESFEASSPSPTLSYQRHDNSPFDFSTNESKSNRGGYVDTLSSRRYLLGYSGRTSMRWMLTFLVGLLIGCIAVFIVKSSEFVVAYREAGLNRLEMSIANQSTTKSLWGSQHTDKEVQYNATNSTDEYSFDPPEITRPATHAVITWWGLYGFKGIFLTYASFNLLLALLSSMMCLKLAPEAIGSGIPEVKAYLNGVRVKKFSSWSCFFVKIIATILSVSSGLGIGPEGPLVHLGAILGAGLTKTSHIEQCIRGVRHRFPYFSDIFGCAHSQDEISSIKTTSKAVQEEQKNNSVWKKLRRFMKNSVLSQIMYASSHFRNDAERRDLISIGAAAGFAAAFGAPVGGVLFSLEEASSFFANQMLWRSLFSTAIATFCIASFSGDLTQFSVISLGDISTPNTNLLHRRFREVPLYVLMGIIGGIMGALFNTIWFKLLEVGIVSLITSSLSFCLPLMWSWACRPLDTNSLHNNEGASLHDKSIDTDLVGHIEFGYSRQFNCEETSVNILANILFGSREKAISSILTDPSSFGSECLLTVGLLFYLLMIITYGVSLPCGIFMPTVLAGSALGGYAGLMFHDKLSHDLAPSLYALLGATALLAGTQRNTVSLCVILMEGTGQTKFLIPIIVTIVVSRYVGDLFSHGIYELGMELKDYPYLEHIDQEYYDIHDVSEVMSYPVICLKTIESGNNIERILNAVNHDGFPVVDDNNHPLGFVRRDQLVALLECCIFTETVPWNNNLNSENLDLMSPASSTDESLTAIFSGSSASDQTKAGELVEDDLRFSFYARDDESSDSATCSCSDNVALNSSATDLAFNQHVRRNSTLMNLALFIRDDRYTSYDENSPQGRDDGNFLLKTYDDVENSDEWLQDNIKVLPDNTVILGADDSLPIIRNFQKHSKTVVKKGPNGKLTIRLSSTDYNKSVDIQAVMNKACHCVLENCPLSTAYKMFTVLGLRHLCVLGNAGKVTGIISRSNLQEEHIKTSIRKK